MEQGKYRIQSVQRAFELTELLGRERELGVSELSMLSGLNKTTVCRMLGTLESLGYVEKNKRTGCYRLTLKLLTVASSCPSLGIKSRLRPSLRLLSDEFGETVHLVERSGDSVVYIDKYESDRNSIRMVSRIGMSQDMTTTAVGKTLLAGEAGQEVLRVWNRTPHEAKTPFTITDYAAFTAELEAVRRLGYAVDNEENETGVRCVARAVADEFGEFRYAVSVSAPVSRMDGERVKEVAARMAQVLG